MGAGKGMAVAPTGLIGHLGTIFLDARIEAVIHCNARGCAQCQLQNALAVFQQGPLPIPWQQVQGTIHQCCDPQICVAQKPLHGSR